MGDGIYAALSGAVARQTELDVLSNNLANVATTGFREDSVSFAEVLAAASRPGRLPPTVRVPGRWAPDDKRFAGVATLGFSRRQGPLRETGNPLDVAIEGDAFLAVETPEGVRYTRGGRLRVSPEGVLTTADGLAVLDRAGRPVRPGPGASEVEIEADGGVRVAGDEVGRIGLWRLGDDAVKEGEQRFRGSAIPVEDGVASLRGGALEGSNVNPLRAMTGLITVHRAFEVLGNVIQSIGQMDSRMTSEVSRLA